MSDPNIDALAVVAQALGELRDEVVFLGGAVLGLLISDEAASPIRPTDDVDLIIEVATRLEYAAFEAKLHARAGSSLTCRTTRQSAGM